jgi:hypothetical protein
MSRHEAEDRSNSIDDDVFSYRVTKDGHVLIYWRNKQVMILKAMQAQKFLAKIANLDDQEAQMVMAKITGNFKRGNERAASIHSRLAGEDRD